MTIYVMIHIVYYTLCTTYDASQQVLYYNKERIIYDAYIFVG